MKQDNTRHAFLNTKIKFNIGDLGNERWMLPCKK